MTFNPPYQSVDPSTGDLLRSFAFATDEEVERALESAHRTYLAWGEVSVAERVEVVRRIGDLLIERSGDLAVLAAREMGKAVSEGAGEIEYSGAIFHYYADHGAKLLAEEVLPSFTSGQHLVLQRRPIGPILGVMPWNYPFYQVARFAAPNLVAGNTVVLKHAESVPGCAAAFESLVLEAGAPAGAFVNVFATHQQVQALVADPRVAGVSLTGSERAGSAVAALAGASLKKCVLELGGSDPYVVLDADDVDAAADLAWDVRMSNVGQACNSNKRMIVMDDIYDQFVDRLVDRASALAPMSPFDEVENGYAPMASRAAAERLHEQVQEAVAAGATLHVGGVLRDDFSAYFSPAVLSGVGPDMSVYRQELFGPVAVVHRVGSDAEALTLANDSDFGLGGAVFSADQERASALADGLQVGMATVNGAGADGVEIPFGGVKRSGFGRELGPLGIEEFLNKRVLCTHDQSDDAA